MFLSNSLLIYSALTVLVGIAGLQDFRMGEVSNWITIPMLVSGLGGALFHLLSNQVTGGLSTLIIVILTLAALKGWMGGADWKILVGLFGLWPLAGLAALVTAGVWGGLAILRSGDRNVRFPGVAAFAVGVTSAFCVRLSMMH
jgi:Flp pilus assembly protein protease CpaA